MKQCSNKGRRVFGLGALFVFALVGQTPEQAAKFAQARDLMSGERFAEAVPLWRDLVASAPGNTGLAMNFGVALHMTGQDAEAVAQLERAVKGQPSGYPPLMMLSMSYVRLGQPGKAVPYLDKALVLKPGDPQARRLLADALLAAGRYEAALPHLRKMTETAPEDPRVWYGLGRCHELLAQKTFDDLFRSAPESPYTLLLAGETRLRQKKFNSAFGFLKEASAKPGGAVLNGLHEALAEVYTQTGHPEWAEAARAQETNPACPSLPCSYAGGKFDEVVRSAKLRRGPEGLFWLTRAWNAQALEAFRKLTALPPSMELYEVIAELQRNQGLYADSLESWGKALEAAPRGEAPRIRREIAATLWISRDFAKAEPALREQLAAGAGDPELNFMLGDALLNQQRGAEAIPFLEKASQADSGNLAVRSALARSFGQAGESAKAIPHLEASLAADTDGALHYQLARAYQAAGRGEEAKKLLLKYQALLKASQQREGKDGGEITAP